ncbi:MAG: family oxidoreductase [Candidatus Poribacteria bacterium]|nr:family oxidoreductase [Candidatus Poribacteria bacterium]
MKELEGKKAIVTGGGRGIGRAIALAMAEEGCDIAVMSRTRDEIERTANEIMMFGSQALAIQADVSDPLDVEYAVNETIKAFGRIDILVNNAGIAIFKPFLELTLNDWDRTMAVNLSGAFLCAQEVAKYMVEQESGTIINICSSASKKAYPNQLAYVASKHGMMGLSKTMSIDLQPYGIKVHAICPGGVDTKLTANARPEVDRSDWMHPEDIAHVVMMLLTMHDRATIDEIYIRRYDSSPI